MEHAKAAKNAAFQAIDSFANVAKNRADGGAIATMAEYVCRAIDRKVAELQTEHEKSR
jgi:hypothetical protein